MEPLSDGDGVRPRLVPDGEMFESYGDDPHSEEAGHGLLLNAVRNQLLRACRHFKLPSLPSGSPATHQTHARSVL
jgi:hypothetical protein